MLSSPLFSNTPLHCLSFSPFPSSLHPSFPFSSLFSRGSISEDRPPASSQGHPPSRHSTGPEIVTLRTFTLCFLFFHLLFFYVFQSASMNCSLILFCGGLITGRSCRKLWQMEWQEIKGGEWWMITLELFPLRHALLEYLKYRKTKRQNRQN